MLHCLTIVYFNVGMLFGYLQGDYGYNPLDWYNKLYYAWDKGLTFMLVLCLMYPLKEMKRFWTIVLCFCGIRLLWEVFAIQDFASASRPSIIFVLFILDLLCIFTAIKVNPLWKLKP